MVGINKDIGVRVHTTHILNGLKSILQLPLQNGY